MVLVAVCRDLDVAAVLVEKGARVVLCCPDAATLGEAARDLRRAPPAGARVAVLVGDLVDPEAAGAALAMARELFGGEPVVVDSVPAAHRLVDPLPGPQPRGSGTV